MSDSAQGPGWWQATDGRWYPPEAHPNYRVANQRPAPPTHYPPEPGRQIGQSAATRVPSQPTKKPWWRRWWAIGLWVVLGVGVISALASNGDETKGEESAAATTAAASSVAAAAPTDQVAVEAVPVTEAQPAASQAVPSTTAELQLTPSQQNAIRSAQSYLDFMAFSRLGLIDQLSSEYGDQYPVEDATFAVDSLNVDWNEQAIKAAKSYLDFQAFSCQGLIDQLSSDYGDQYTVEQATVGAQAAGIC